MSSASIEPNDSVDAPSLDDVHMQDMLDWCNDFDDAYDSDIALDADRDIDDIAEPKQPESATRQLSASEDSFMHENKFADATEPETNYISDLHIPYGNLISSYCVVPGGTDGSSQSCDSRGSIVGLACKYDFECKASTKALNGADVNQSANFTCTESDIVTMVKLCLIYSLCFVCHIINYICMITDHL